MGTSMKTGTFQTGGYGVSTICIVSNNQIEANKVRESLGDLESYQRVDYEYMRPAQVTNYINPEIDLLVYNNSHNLDMNLKQKVVSWRKRGFLGSILVMSKVKDNQLLAQMNSLHNFVVLEKPYADRDLAGMAQKFLKTIEVNQRRYRRFSTDQNVQVESYKTDFKADSKVRNISLGGLCLDGDWNKLLCGDLLKITFPLDKLNREYTMNAKVIWVRGENKSEAGVEFVKDEDVYSQLLSSMG